MDGSQHDKSDSPVQRNVAGANDGPQSQPRTKGLKSEDPSSSARPPLERGSEVQSFALDLNKRDSQEQDEDVPQDLSSQAHPVLRDSSTESIEHADMQYVVLDDEDEDDGSGNVDDFGQSDSMDSPGEEGGMGENEGRGTGLLLKCSMCDRVFSSQQQLMLHVNKHMGAKPYACPQCPANFNSRASFQRHRRSHKNSMDDVQTHTCSLCHAKFSNIQHLTEHLKIHTEKRRSCPHCGTFIGGSRSLQKHISIEHPNMIKKYRKHRPPSLGSKIVAFPAGQNEVPLPSLKSSPVSCRLCNRQFQTNRALQGHMKGHSRLYQWNPRRCQCGVLLADEAEYQRHLKNSCCSSSGNAEVSPTMPHPAGLLALSPTSTSQMLALSAERQMAFRRRSLDSYMRHPVQPLAIIGNYHRSADSALQAGDLSPNIESRFTQNLEPHPSLQPQSSSSSTGGETSSGVQSLQPDAPRHVDRVTIKSEDDWSEVVDIVEVNSNATGSEETSGDHTPAGSELGSGQLPRFAFSPEGDPQSHERRQERHEVNLVLRGQSGQLDGSQGQASHSLPSGAEASSSDHPTRSLAVGPVESLVRTASPRFSSPHQESSGGTTGPAPSMDRRMTESPNSQITSSQSGNPAQPLLGNPSLAEREQDGSPRRCSHCGITFEDSLMYVIHKGCHEPGSQFKCSMCGEQCADKVTFMLHFVRGQHTSPTHV